MDEGDDGVNWNNFKCCEYRVKYSDSINVVTRIRLKLLAKEFKKLRRKLKKGNV